jgi:single-stranded DNA-binding protein
MNSVRMTGRLTSEPKLKHIGTKKRAVCEMRLAVDNGRYPTTFINLSVFDAPAYVAAEHLSKGCRVKVEGELRFRERTAAGVRRHEPHSIVGRVEQLVRPSKAVNRPDSVPAGSAAPAPTLA